MLDGQGGFFGRINVEFSGEVGGYVEDGFEGFDLAIAKAMGPLPTSMPAFLDDFEYAALRVPHPIHHALDNTATDHEWFETELLAQDRDADWVSTAEVDEPTARQIVNELVNDDVVTAVPAQRVLVHEPSNEAFDSISQLAM